MRMRARRTTVAKRKTVAELEREIEILRPYQEMTFCLLSGEVPTTIIPGNDDAGDHLLYLLYGAGRASGGVVTTGYGSQSVLGYACCRAV
jgi:hypothetical protein